MMITAKLNYLRIAPRKVRLIAGSLKQKSVNEITRQLDRLPHRSARSLLKLVRSAASDAKHNFGLEPDTLYLKEIRVDQGPALKRSLPRAFGRADMVKKYSSHVTVVLETKSEVGKIKRQKSKKK